MFPGHLHALIYIIADKPTKENVSAKIPLVGTKSYKKLLVWLGEMDVDVSRVRMYNQVDKPFDNPLTKMSLNKAVELNQIKVLSLGTEASKYLDQVGITNYFLLPHPSGRNRILNDKKMINLMLKEAKKYVYQIQETTAETDDKSKAPAEQSHEG